MQIHICLLRQVWHMYDVTLLDKSLTVNIHLQDYLYKTTVCNVLCFSDFFLSVSVHRILDKFAESWTH